jgi:pimeloyl-ACP methyl ester carboxylesterase
MFRNLIPQFADDYHVIAPDLPGFGCSDAPAHDKFQYTLEHIAQVMGDFVEEIGLKKFAIYVFDYGAPTGFRIALWLPDRITALISQNGNAYLEGLSQNWVPVQTYWENPTRQNRETLRQLQTLETTRWQYYHGVSNPEDRIAPEAILHDQTLLKRPQSAEIQLDLIGDYKSNVELYPKFQEFFRSISPRRWRCGARTIRSSYHRAQRPTNATSPRRRSSSTIRGILHWRPMRLKSVRKLSLF